MFYYLISAGEGPAECQRAVYLYSQKIIQFLVLQDTLAEVRDIYSGDYPECYKSCVIATNKSAVLESWCGSILWKSKSPFRPHHKRQNWFISMSPVDSFTSQSEPLVGYYFEPHKSSGPGGQHVNKTMSAVRIVHPASGLSFNVSDSRSQHKNKQIALDRLKTALAELQIQALMKSEAQKRLQHCALERGNPTRRFKGAQFMAY